MEISSKNEIIAICRALQYTLDCEITEFKRIDWLLHSQYVQNPQQVNLEAQEKHIDTKERIQFLEQKLDLAKSCLVDFSSHAPVTLPKHRN